MYTRVSWGTDTEVLVPKIEDGKIQNQVSVHVSPVSYLRNKYFLTD